MRRMICVCFSFVCIVRIIGPDQPYDCLMIAKHKAEEKF